jgi:hypothetical protein
MGTIEAIAIPIVAIGMGTMVPITFVIALIVLIVTTLRNARARRAELHKERMLALEKGLPLPEDVKAAFDPKRRFLGSMQAGIICLMAGLGTAIALGLVAGWVHAAWGGILFFIGLGFVIFAIIVQASAKDIKEMDD